MFHPHYEYVFQRVNIDRDKFRYLFKKACYMIFKKCYTNYLIFIKIKLLKNLTLPPLRKVNRN